MDSLKISEDIVWTDLGDEIVVLNLDTGLYFGLAQTGARIWSLILNGSSREEILITICAEYDVPGEQAARDLDQLIAELSGEGLVKLSSIRMV